MKILAVDDDAIFLRLLSVNLTKMNYTDVTLVDSPQSALRALDTTDTPFDCFLLDINMPGMDGIALCEAIRKRPTYASAPILMLTGLSGQDDMAAAFKAGATDYTTKPIDELELSTRLKLAGDALARKQEIDLLHAEVEAKQYDAGGPGRVSLSTSFALDDVLGSIEYLAFENFLYRTSVEAHRVFVFAVKIRNADEIFQAADTGDFMFLVNSVGDVIGDALKSRKFFLTYAGNGVFAIALLDGIGLDLEGFSANLFYDCAELEIRAANGKALGPELVIGAPAKSSFLPWKANVDALSEAISNVETAALEVRMAASALPSPKLRKLSPLQRLLRAS